MKIHLHNHLKTLHPEPIELKVSNWPQLYKALESTIPDFRLKFKEADEVALVKRTGDKHTSITKDELEFPLVADELHIIPNVKGSGTGMEFALMYYLGASASTAMLVTTIATNLLVSVALSFVVGALAPKPSVGSSSSAEKRDSFYFNGAQNVTDPGTALPIVVGEFIVGSVVVSIGVETVDINIPTT